MSARRILVLSAAPLLFADYLGIPPRPSSSDYAAHADSGSVSVGASAATAAEVRKVFGWDWTSRYLFFEVALYPEAGKQLTVAPRDFMLRVGVDSDSSRPVDLSPVDAETIVPGPKPMSTTSPAGSTSPVDVRVRETIGYSTGPYNRGVYTDTQVGVAVDNRGGQSAPPPARTRSDKDLELYRALMDNELPDAKTSKPIAGYLYFPRPKGMKKGEGFELRYYGAADRMTLSVPAAKGR
jgi:hypothetical protein